MTPHYTPLGSLPISAFPIPTSMQFKIPICLVTDFFFLPFFLTCRDGFLINATIYNALLPSCLSLVSFSFLVTFYLALSVLKWVGEISKEKFCYPTKGF